MVYPTKKELIQQHPLFESLSWWQTGSVAKRASIVEVPKGEVVIEEGEPATAFYLVISGRCEAFRRDGPRRVIDHYHNGDSFGEMALLSEEPHWCSVRARNDSLLLKLKKEDFDDLVSSNAQISRQISRKIASRMSRARERKKKASYSKVISIGSAREEIGKTLFGINVAALLREETGEPICLVDFTRHGEELNIQEIPTSSSGMSDWVESVAREHPSGIDVIPASFPKGINKDLMGPFFGSFMTRFDYVFVILPEGLSPLEMEIYEQSDEIYLLTDLDHNTLYQTRLLINELEGELGEDLARPRVILSRLPMEKMGGPTGADRYLDRPVSYKLPELSGVQGLTPLEDPPYVSVDPDHLFSRNVRRIARQIGNVSVGLALGAGAARGLAHIGVIRVLEEAGILVDVVAGTSIGALIASGWAIGSNADDMEKLAYEFKERGGFFQISDLSFPPTKSLLRSGRIRDFLEFMLEDATFSDTQFPVKMTATNLDTLEETVIEKGPLVDAVQSSIAIPMLFPPVQENGRMLVDGGVLNPVPVGPLLRENVGNIIAVNPIPPMEVLRENRRSGRDVSPDGSGWSWVKQQLLPFGEGNIIDTFMRSLQAMQSRLASSAGGGADVLMNPVVATEEWYEFEQVEAFIREGEKTAREHLPEIRELLDRKESSPRGNPADDPGPP